MTGFNFRFSLEDTDRRIIARLAAKKDSLLEKFASRVTYFLLKLQQKIVSEKLSGGVLKSRSGVLANSVTVEPAQITGYSVEGSVVAGQGPAFYGKFHEDGGNKSYTIYPVTKTVLKFMIGGEIKYSMWANRKPLPKRSFMASSLREMSAEIYTGLYDVLVEEIRL